MSLRGTARVLGRAISLLRFAILLPLIAAACVPTTSPVPGPTATAEPALVTPAAPTLTPYTQMIRDYGIPLDIPQHGKFILVNIPSFELIAFQDGNPVLRSRVVVGRPSTETPDLYSNMWALKYNPDWTPTANMIRNESAVYVKPGPNNPLGLLKFELDNNQAIYLHDTNRKDLFDRERRAYSHGCVRVQNYLDLAAWVAGVPVSEIQQNINTRRTYIDRLPESIPVYLGYYIFFPDESGRIQSYPDLYGRSGTVPTGYKVVSPASNETAAVIAPLMPGEVALPMQVSTGRPVPPPRPSAPRPTVAPAAPTPTVVTDETAPTDTAPAGDGAAPLTGVSGDAAGAPVLNVEPATEAPGGSVPGDGDTPVSSPATGTAPAGTASTSEPATEPAGTAEPPAATSSSTTTAPAATEPAATTTETCVAGTAGCPAQDAPNP